MAGSHFMGLSIPSPGTTLGPLYAKQVSDSLTKIDGHDHTEGSGARVPSRGLLINNDLPFGNYNLTGARTVRFQAQDADANGPKDLGCLYVKGVDLFFRDGSGNIIRATINGQINNAAPGSIAGLQNPASASFGGGYAGSGKFTWKQNTSWYAGMVSGALEVRDSTVNNPANGVTIKSPVGLAAAYAITLPSGLPASESFVTMNNSGVLATGPTKAGGIDTANIADGAVTKAKLASLGMVSSVSTGAWVTPGSSGPSPRIMTVANLGVTPISCTVAATGTRPLMVRLEWDQVANGGNLTVYKNASGGLFQPSCRIEIGVSWGAGPSYAAVVNSGLSASLSAPDRNGLWMNFPASMLSGVHVPTGGAGLYTFGVRWQTDTEFQNNTQLAAPNIRLVAWEM